MDLIFVTNAGAKTTIQQALGPCDVVIVNDGSDLYEQDWGLSSDYGSWTLKPEFEGRDRYVFAFEPGFERLRDQLALSFGDERCWWVNLEADPWKYPLEELATLIRNAKRMWSDEIFTFGDLPPEQPQEAFTTGFPMLDRHGFRLVRSAFMPVIGPYASGKSVLLRQLAVNMWRQHGWRSLFTTFEEKPSRFERDFRLHLAHARGTHTDPNGPDISREMAEAFRGLRRNRYDLLDVDRLSDRIEYACRVYGVDMVVIDPVNEVDHVVNKGESKTDYMGRFIMRLKHIADDHNLLMVCAAHPPKDSGGRRNSNHLYTLNDGADTAHYGNKADIGWCVWRPDLTDGRTYLNIDKCKDVDVMGRPDVCKLRMNAAGAFEVTDMGPTVMAEILGADE